MCNQTGKSYCGSSEHKNFWGVMIDSDNNFSWQINYFIYFLVDLYFLGGVGAVSAFIYFFSRFDHCFLLLLFFGIFYFILLCTVASSESSFSLCLTVIVLMSVKFVSLSCVLCNLSCVQHLPHYFDHQLYKLHFSGDDDGGGGGGLGHFPTTSLRFLFTFFLLQ